MDAAPDAGDARCAGRHRHGEAVRKGHPISMEARDDLVVGNLTDRPRRPQRLAALLTEIVERRSATSAAVGRRLVGLGKAIADAEERSKRLHRAIGVGIVALDDLSTARITRLEAERAKARAAFGRAVSTGGLDGTIDAAKVEAFGLSIRETMGEATRGPARG